MFAMQWAWGAAMTFEEFRDAAREIAKEYKIKRAYVSVTGGAFLGGGSSLDWFLWYDKNGIYEGVGLPWASPKEALENFRGAADAMLMKKVKDGVAHGE